MQEDWVTATAVLRVTSQLIDDAQEEMAARGFGDVRPSHGFVFAALSGRPLSTSGLAAALSISKQAAAQLADHLVERGYLERRPDPADARSRLLVLTDRGVACTRAAELAHAHVIARWREQLGQKAFDALATGLRAVATPGRLRPSW
jgi:DNA-binding MarR family transcriptional regulator